jgi:hypothetical protein
METSTVLLTRIAFLSMENREETHLPTLLARKAMIGLLEAELLSRGIGEPLVLAGDLLTKWAA